MVELDGSRSKTKSQEEDAKPIVMEKCWHWPRFGKFYTVYNTFMLGVCLVQAFMIVARAAFEDKPNWYSTLLELFMNAVFFVDMIRNFLQPYMQENNVMQHRFCSIFCNYIKGWFILDICSFVPIAYFRSVSNWEDGSQTDDLQNLQDLNFERLPKLYIIILLIQLVRARNLLFYINFAMDAYRLRDVTKSINITLFKIIYILHVSGCFWYMTTSTKTQDAI